MILTAKQLIPNKSWIVEDGKEKVATLNKNKNGYIIMSRGRKFEAHDLTELRERFGINISSEMLKNNDSHVEKEIYGYPVKSKPYNPVWNVPKKLPIYAKSSKSKSLYCAGYYVINFPKIWGKAFCPKLITLERYPYYGPFKTELEARAVLNAKYNEDKNELT